MPEQRRVAGLTCGEVLADLSAYLDEELDPRRRARIDAHLRGCDWCERFGGELAGAVAALRRHLAEPEPVPEEVRRRLRRRLSRLG